MYLMGPEVYKLDNESLSLIFEDDKLFHFL